MPTLSGSINVAFLFLLEFWFLVRALSLSQGIINPQLTALMEGSADEGQLNMWMPRDPGHPTRYSTGSLSVVWGLKGQIGMVL